MVSTLEGLGTTSISSLNNGQMQPKSEILAKIKNHEIKKIKMNKIIHNWYCFWDFCLPSLRQTWQHNNALKCANWSSPWLGYILGTTPFVPSEREYLCWWRILPNKRCVLKFFELRERLHLTKVDPSNQSSETQTWDYWSQLCQVIEKYTLNLWYDIFVQKMIFPQSHFTSPGVVELQPRNATYTCPFSHWKLERADLETC